MKTPGSGRKVGTPNKKTQDLMERCKAAEVDPFDILLNLAKNSQDESMRFSAAKEVCQYLYPKRKAVEHKVLGDSTLECILTNNLKVSGEPLKA